VRELVLHHGDVTITLRGEECYTLGSADNSRRYDHEYKVANGGFTSYHGVVCEQAGRIRSCIVAGSRGPTTIHNRSAVLQGSSLFLAVGQ
jgi:hypothetical protein